MSFPQRMAQAIPHEQAVIDALRRRGWDAEPFGQGQLTAVMRGHLYCRKPVTPVRWLPDVIAARSTAARVSRVVFVDAKAGETWRETGNHDIERDALDAAESWAAWSGCRVVYVFTDGLTVTPDRVQAVARDGTWRGRGSKTPFVIFSRMICKPFDVEFPTEPT